MNNIYTLTIDGILLSSKPVTHRDEEYDQDGFVFLREMQERHFWYRGQHLFLLSDLERHLPKSATQHRAIDLGGAGGWYSTSPRS